MLLVDLLIDDESNKMNCMRNEGREVSNQREERGYVSCPS